MFLLVNNMRSVLCFQSDTMFDALLFLLLLQEEVKSLKKTIEELNESNKSLVLSVSTPGTAGGGAERSHYAHFNQPLHGSGQFRIC